MWSFSTGRMKCVLPPLTILDNLYMLYHTQQAIYVILCSDNECTWPSLSHDQCKPTHLAPYSPEFILTKLVIWISSAFDPITGLSPAQCFRQRRASQKKKQRHFRTFFIPGPKDKMATNGKINTNPSGSSHGEQLVPNWLTLMHIIMPYSQHLEWPWVSFHCLGAVWIGPQSSRVVSTWRTPR